LFGFKEQEVPTLLWVNVMSQLRKGVLGLQLFNVESNKWGQAHTQGAYVFAQYLYQNQQNEMIRFEVTEDNVLIHLDQALLWTEGQALISKFLTTIQTYKSTGCIDRATSFFTKYSVVKGIFLQIRTIVMNKKKPRRLELNHHLVRYNETTIEPICYPESFEGIIKSFADRFPFNKDFRDEIVQEWDRTKEFVRP
jgi:dipeptidyl-peptidase III